MSNNVKHNEGIRCSIFFRIYVEQAQRGIQICTQCAVLPTRPNMPLESLINHLGADRKRIHLSMMEHGSVDCKMCPPKKNVVVEFAETNCIGNRSMEYASPSSSWTSVTLPREVTRLPGFIQNVLPGLVRTIRRYMTVP